LAATGHIDTFAHDNLPARATWPDFLFTLPELSYPERLNCVSAFLDSWIDKGEGGRPCLIAPTESLT
jgi:2-aminobenzoate-CoA ligase